MPADFPDRDAVIAADAGPPSAAVLGAVADWYHAQFTGLVLYLVGRHGADDASVFIHEIFSHQRTEKFLPGLKKLGLDGLPHAVAAARYHYLSNWIGGVGVEYVEESDRKAWVRYAAPRWIWAGTALCAVPSSVTVAMLRGWHAQNGVMLDNPRLGFVCTRMATDGDSGLEGYYREYDRDLAPDERLRFAPDEDAPDFDPAAAPALPSADWPPERLEKARRNYAMEYMRSAYVVGLRLWGEAEASRRLGMAARLVGMQLYPEIARGLGAGVDPAPLGFADFVCRLARGQGDDARTEPDGDGFRVVQRGWRIADGIGHALPVLVASGREAIVGASFAHDRRLAVSLEPPSSQDDRLAWRISKPR